VLVGAVLRLENRGRAGFDGRAWLAGDGVNWRAATVTGLDGPGDQRMGAALPVGPGFLAMAAAAGRLVPVRSADGRR
jgi:hypothetical protein